MMELAFVLPTIFTAILIHDHVTSNKPLVYMKNSHSALANRIKGLSGHPGVLGSTK